ncbi:MAG: protein translocase SEC61 complex subunit gamma [Candidatus Micrarchaeota archaeon]
MGIMNSVGEFIQQSQRVLNVTHKPAGIEYRQIAISTAVGMAIVGAIGFIVHTAANLLRGF